MPPKKVETLPDYKPRILNHAYGKTLKCRYRDKNIVAGPEELVRQRVLKWLMEDRSWPKHRIALERNLSFATGPRRRGRPDIVLYDDGHNVCMVIECKALGVPLDEAVFEQARTYADKMHCETIWLTDGDVNIFYTKDGEWNRNSAGALGVVGSTPVPIPSPPNANDRRAVKRYLRRFEDQRLSDLSEPRHNSTMHFVLAVHTIMFDLKPKRLPYSHKGVHILEDRGVRYHSFSNPSGRWTGLYRTFLVATEGRVETASVGLQRYASSDHVILCVGFQKEKRVHHALQLNSSNCEMSENGNWKVWHSGKVGGRSLPRSKVVEAIEEADALHLLGPQQGDKYVDIGTLPAASDITWNNTKKFLANLLHYSILRTNLRDAQAK